MAAPQALALALGEPELRSALGERLDLRIPVTIGKGESIEPACFTLSRDGAAQAPRLTAARISLERSAQGTYLRIRTDSAVSEPALTLGIAASCPGQSSELRRDYSLLVDPRTSAAPPASRLATTFPSAVATLIARIGDTLESIANAIFPHNRAAKKSYIDALRESNPPLASLSDRDPIPVDTPIALPDLRTFARHGTGETHAATVPPRIARAPVEANAPAARPAPPRAAAESTPPARTPDPVAIPPPRERPAAAQPRTPAREERVVARAAAPVRKQPTEGYVLKLSSAEVDLSRSGAFDDRMRAQLRDRQLVLDADDQVAAVLALRNSVRQLESRVAELQLKLAGMPSSFPPPKNVEPAKAAEAPKATPAPEPVAKSEPPAPITKVEPRSTVTTAEPPAAAESPKLAVSEPVPAPPPVAETKGEPVPASTPIPASPSTEPMAQPRPTAKAPVPVAPFDWLYYGLWLLALMLVAAAAVLAWRLARRRREESFYEEASAPAAQSEEEEDRIVVADEFREEPVLVHEPPTTDAAPRRELDSDVELSTRLPDTNTDDLRRRYIEERFPEIGKGAIVLDDSASVVKGARLFYEDGALARAVELLHYAIERKPEEVRNWLALFEVFRLERLSGEFAELARRFREQHGKSDYWRKVQYFGREIDPGNELYAPPRVNTFETIGPSQAKRLAAETTFDPVAENWLGMPMDFQNEVLANELRKTLMSEAGIGEQDLVPNPMPALRNIEMFSVA